MIWKDEQDETYKYALDELGVTYDENSLKELIDIVCSYEKYYDIFVKQDMVNLINEKCKIKVPNSFVDELGY